MKTLLVVLYTRSGFRSYNRRLRKVEIDNFDRKKTNALTILSAALKTFHQRMKEDTETNNCYIILRKWGLAQKRVLLV